MGQVLTKNEGFSDFCEGWVPLFLLEIKQKAGWLVGMGYDWKGKLCKRGEHSLVCPK